MVLQCENIFIAQNLANSKLDEICVMILKLNVFGTLTWNILLPISNFLKSPVFVILSDNAKIKLLVLFPTKKLTFIALQRRGK